MNNTTEDQQIVEKMIDSISKEKILRQVLRDNKIAVIDKIYEINPYKRDGGRRGLIADVQEKGADTRSKIMIDLKQGEPIINQVYDSLYDIGKNCQVFQKKMHPISIDYLNFLFELFNSFWLLWRTPR